MTARGRSISIDRTYELFLVAYLFLTWFFFYPISGLSLSLHSLLVPLIVFLAYQGGVSGRSVSQSFKVSRIEIGVILIVFWFGIPWLVFFEFRSENIEDFRAYALGLLTALALKKLKNIEVLEKFFHICRSFLVLNGGFSAIQFFGYPIFPASYFSANVPENFVVGLTAGVTQSAMLGLVSTSVVIGSLLYSNQRKGSRIISVFAVFAGIGTIALTGSRAALLGLIIVLILLPLTHRGLARRADVVWRYGMHFILGMYLIFVVVVALLVTALSEALNFEAARFIQYKLTTLSDDSTGARFEVWQAAINALSEFPLAFISGIGFGTFSIFYGLNPHNSFFEILTAAGIFGLFFLISCCYISIRRCFLSGEGLSIGLGLALISMMVMMFFHDLVRSRVFWILIGFSFAQLSRSNSNRAD